MIEYIKGQLDDLTPTQATVEAGGVGYALLVSLNTYSDVQGKRDVKLYVYEAIREDAHLLYGFATKQERELFTLLISVNGVGGQTARMILSAFTPAELAGIIQNEDVRSLKSVKGIGPKAAQRIILDLRDKVMGILADGGGAAEAGGGQPVANKAVVDEAVSALTVLGFPPAPTHKVIMQLIRQQPDATVEELIKQGLKLL